MFTLSGANVLTKRDLDEIEGIVEEKIDEKTKNLPTKDEFYEKMDEVIGELKAMREEHTVLSSQVSDHEDRITKLEESTSVTFHPLA